MNRKTHEVVSSPEFDKDSDEPDGYDDREYNLEEHDSPIIIRSKKSESPIGISLSDIIEGEEDGDEEEEEQADNTNDMNAGETHQKTRKREPEEEEFNTSHFFIKICMYGIIMSAWGLIVLYLNLPLQDGILGVQGSEWVTTFLGVMSMICFYQSSNASNVNPTQKTPPYATLSNSNFCDFCQKWKPERTHHCRSCGQCVLRMDHHCLWICNCVGYRNHKAFLLFCFYTGIGSLYFDYRAIYFFIWEAMNQKIFDFSAYFLIFLLVCTFIVLPVGLMALGLAVYHFVLAMNNLTTLETLSGINIINPFHFKNLKPKKHINKYDNGVLANLSEFFGHSYLLWWWPTIRTIYHDGQVFDQIKEPLQKTNDDPKNELRDYSYLNKLKPANLNEIDIEQILRQAEDYTKDKGLEFDVDAIDREKEQIEQQLKGPEMKDPYIPRRKSFHETEEALRIIQQMKESSDKTIYYDDDFDEIEREEAKDVSKRGGIQGKDRAKDLSISTASQASVEDRRKKE